MMELRAAEISEIIKRQIQGYDKQLELRETGTVLSASDGIARIYGLDRVAAGELLQFPHNIYGLALNLRKTTLVPLYSVRCRRSKRATKSAAPAASLKCLLARPCWVAWSMPWGSRSMAKAPLIQQKPVVSKSKRPESFC